MMLLAIHNAVVTITLDARATYNIAAQEHLWVQAYEKTIYYCRISGNISIEHTSN